MGSLYSGTSVSGYNSNPPPDDGSTGTNNQITWGSAIKAKLADPLLTAINSMSTALVTGLAKTISGGTVVKTAISYAMGPADQGRAIVATASGITITTPDATSVLNPFMFFFSNQSTGTITLAGNGAQTVDGNNTTTIYPDCGGIVQTDGSNWFTNGLVQGNIRTKNPAYGFDMPVNLQINATVGSNLLTIAVKANNGADPSPSNPVLIPFRDPTLANGDPVWVAITSALSINTNATGATLGTANGVPFRLWVTAFYNGGTPVLALWQSVTGGATPTAIAPLNEATDPATTGISAAATSAGTFYTPNGTSLSAFTSSFRILCYVDYASGLTTAGTYASAPTTVQLFGPGIKKPGDIVQTIYAIDSTSDSVSSTTYAASTHGQITITPTAAPNLIFASMSGVLSNNTTNDTTFGKLSRGTVGNTGLFGNEAQMNANANSPGSFNCFGYDAPGTTSSTTYALQIKVGSGAGGICPGNAPMSMQLQEIMI